MVSDPRFLTNATRLQHVELVDAAVGGFIRTKTLKENLETFEKNSITAGPVNDASMLLDDEFVASRESLILFGIPGSEIPMHNVTSKFSQTPGNIYGYAPAIGENTAEVLGKIFDKRTLDAFRAERIIV
jgi:formyl-CoA transferase